MFLSAQCSSELHSSGIFGTKWLTADNEVDPLSQCVNDFPSKLRVSEMQ